MSIHLRRFFKEYNKKYFGNSLPDVPVFFSEDTHPKCAAELISFEDGSHHIRFHPSMKEFRRYSKMILLHEMTHLEQRNMRIKDHGIKFKARMRDLVAQGAFDKLW